MLDSKRRTEITFRRIFKPFTFKVGDIIEIAGPYWKRYSRVQNVRPISRGKIIEIQVYRNYNYVTVDFDEGISVGSPHSSRSKYKRLYLSIERKDLKDIKIVG